MEKAEKVEIEMLFHWPHKSQDNVLPPPSGCTSNDHPKEELKHRHCWGAFSIPAKTRVAVYRVYCTPSDI